MHLANTLCRKMQQKYTPNFYLSIGTAVLTYLQVRSQVLFPLSDSLYWCFPREVGGVAAPAGAAEL